MFDSLFHWIGTYYRDGLYLGGAKIAGILCSYADIFVVAAFLKIMDVIRKRPPSKWRFRTLFLFAVLTPALLLPKKGLDFFIVQFLVLAPPYLILVCTAVIEARHFVSFVKAKVGFPKGAADSDQV